MTNYKRGYNFEKRVQKALEDKGYFVVRSAGSKGPVDLVAIDDGQVYLIQCKRQGHMPPQEWNNLFLISSKLRAMPLLAHMPAGKKRGIEFIQITGVRDAYSRVYPGVQWEP